MGDKQQGGWRMCPMISEGQYIEMRRRNGLNSIIRLVQSTHIVTWVAVEPNGDPCISHCVFLKK